MPKRTDKGRKPPAPPPRKIIHRSTGGPNSGSKGNAHAGKGNPHGRGKR